MHANVSLNPSRGKRIAQVLLLLGLGYMAGQSSNVLGTARADIRKGERRQAFQAGGERSEIVLREISKTLKTIDARIARIEKVATSRNPDRSH